MLKKNLALTKKKKKKKEKEFRLCLVTVFIFYFQKLVFGNINKFFFLYFWNKKHVLLVEIKNIVFEEKKKKLKYVATRIWTVMLTY